jgi:hypothetical protein
MTRTIAAAAVLSLTMSTVPAFAADEANGATAPAATPQAGPGVSDNIVWGNNNIVWGANKVADARPRPTLLPVLYASHAALQAYDVYSTRQALSRGAREMNPLMQGVVKSPAAFVAVKAGVAAGTILAAERLWKNDRKAAAIGVMIASNAVAAIVASKNARTLRHIR